MERYITLMPLAGLLLIIPAVYFLIPFIEASSGTRIARPGQKAPLFAFVSPLAGVMIATIGVIGSIMLSPTIWSLPLFGW